MTYVEKIQTIIYPDREEDPFQELREFSQKPDRHPEKRVKAAKMRYEEIRMPQMKKEYPSLRFNQLKHMIFEEFQKSDCNPMNCKQCIE